MGFFSFLENDDPTLLEPDKRLPKQKVSEDEGFKFPASEGENALEAPKPYPQRRGESTSQVLQTAERIISKLESQAPGDPKLKQLANKARNDIRANPEDAAKTIEKFHGKIAAFRPADKIGAATTLTMPGLYDTDFSALENHVRSLRVMKRGPEEKGLSEGLAQTDQSKNLAELHNLRGQLDVLTKEISTAKDTMPEAVSSRGEQENQRILGEKQQKAAAIAEHIKQLEAVTNKPSPSIAPEQDSNMEQLGAVAGEVVSEPITRYMNGLGINRPALVSKLHAALQRVGIPKEEWYTQDVDPRAGLLRVLSELDKDGAFAQMVAQQMAGAKQGDAQEGQKQPKPEGPDPGMMKTQFAIQRREAEMKQLFASLRQTPFMKTWPGMILFVLVSLITRNPAMAAKLVGGVGGTIAGDVDREAVAFEIRGIQGDIRRLDDQLSRQEQQAQMRRREAVMQLQRERDRKEDFSRDLSKMFINHQLILQRAKQRTSPENRTIVSKLEGDYNRVIRQMSEAEKIMNNNWLDDDDPKKIEASNEYSQLKREAQFLDNKLRSLTEQMAPGTYTKAAAENP